MKKDLIRGGCALVVMILLLIALGGAAWWVLIGRYTLAAVTPTSLVDVVLLSPSSGQDLAAGAYVPVTLRAAAPQGISSAELYVDGQFIGSVTESPESASWTWLAWPVGVHTLAARATSTDQSVGESQVLIVNVIAAHDVISAPAGAGQTLADVGGKFGVPVNDMAAANPQTDPSKPLEDGQLVNVPTGGAGEPPPGGGGGSGPGGGSEPFLINWEFKPSGQVDTSYCYLSDGGGKWNKMPKQPFEFFGGVDNLYTQVFDAIPLPDATFKAQCWGWLDGVLKYLGEAETKSVTQNPIQLIGSGFQLTGLPKWPEGKESHLLGGGQPTVPPPYALREPKDSADCTAHAHPWLGGFICDTLMNAKVKEYVILEWEWQPGLPGTGNWINDIAGYEIYQILPDTGAPPQYLKSVKPLAAKAAAVPLPWGNYCFGVTAFADSPKYGGKVVSEMVTHCLGQAPASQKTTLTPSDWITTQQHEEIACGSVGMADSYVFASQEGYGAQPEVAVGSWVLAKGLCYASRQYAAAVRFPNPALPSGSVIQKAVLTFSKDFMEYSASGVALGAKPSSCVAAVGRAKLDWSGLGDASHFSTTYLATSAYYEPLVSVPAYSAPSVDVTAAVSGWFKNPAKNFGLVLAPVKPPSGTGSDPTAECTTGLGNFKLEIHYLAAGN